MINIELKKYLTKEEFMQDLQSRCLNSSSFEETIAHEEAHFKMAEEKGYSPKYYIKNIEITLKKFNLNLPFPGVRIEELIKPKHLKNICLAPKKPSISDKFCASNLYLFIYKNYYNSKLKGDFEK